MILLARRFRRSPVFSLAILTATYAHASANKLVIGVLATSIQQSLLLTDIEISFVQGFAFAISYALTGILAGRLRDRGARTYLLVGGVSLWSGAAICCALADSLPLLLVARVVMGIGESVILPVGLAAVVERAVPEKRGATVGIFLSGSYIGLGLATLLGGVGLDTLSAAGLTEGWRYVMTALGLLGIPLAIACAFIDLRERAVGAVAAPADLRFRQTQWPQFATIVAAMTLCNVMEYALGARLPTLLERSFAFSHALIGLSLGPIAILLGVMGTMLGGRLADGLGTNARPINRPRVALWLFIVASPLALFGFGSTASLILLGYAMFSLVINGAGAAAIAATQDAVADAQRGTATAIQALCFTAVGLGLGPTAGAIAASVGAQSTIGAGGGLSLLAAGLVAASIALMARATFNHTALTKEPNQ